MAAMLRKQDYVDAALEVVQQVGFAGLTAKSLGAHLGVDPSAMYRHFTNKDELVVAMFDRIAEQHQIDISEAEPFARIRRHAQVVRNFFLAVPELASVLGNAPQMPRAMVGAATDIIEALREIGLHDRELVAAYQAIENLVIGTMMFETAGTPLNYEIRRSRYREMGDEFERTAHSTDQVREMATTAFVQSLDALLAAVGQRDVSSK